MDYNKLDTETKRHSLNVAKIIIQISNKIEISDLDILIKAAKYHDVGKLLIPPSILHKQGVLTKEERMLIDYHSCFGYRLLKESGFPEKICQIVLLHHGLDKPCGDIPKENLMNGVIELANILRTVDAYEAISAKRCYHQPQTPNDTISIMLKEGVFNNNVLQVLQKLYSEETKLLIAV